VRQRSILLAIAAAALAAATAAAGHHLTASDVEPYDFGFVPRGAAVRWLSLGHPTLAANLYWLRAVQYMGDPRADARGWEKLFPVLDLVTDLDPGHGYAYQVGANVLGGAGRVRESNRLLEKGIRNVPDRYILPFQRAVNAFLYQGDYAEAGRWFEVAAHTPGAPPHLRENVVAMYVKGNQADAAIAFLGHLLASADDPESKKALEKQLARARFEREAQRIDEALRRYRERSLVGPYDLRRVVEAGFLPALPADPAGGSWYIGEDGRVRSTRGSERYQEPIDAEERARSVRMLRDQMRSPPPP
jgi:tetratricopeptide (TPR) repeat protein